MRARALAILALLTLASAAHAAPLRVVVLVGADDDAVLARLEGQIADLPVTLSRGPAPAAARDLPRQLASAGAVARTSGADAVVWFIADGDGWIVNVADPRAGRVLVRRIDAGGGALSSSAALEAAALVVRTALRGLAAGGEIGVAAPPAVSEPVTREPIVREPPPHAVRTPRRTTLFAEVGWIAALDGDAAVGHHGVAAALGARRDRWQLAATASLYPASKRTDALASVQLDRQELGLRVGRALTAGPRWRTSLGVSVAAVRFGRATTATGGGLTPTADHATWGAAVAPSLAVARHLGGGAWLTVTIGAAALTAAPAFEVRGPSGPIEVGRLWPIEPVAGLAIVIDPR